MGAHKPVSVFERLVAPWALLLGVAAAFLGCCAAGRLAGSRNHIHHLERFHALVGPDTLYYPTVCEMCQLARSRLDPGKVVVIIGGSSVLHGTCQTADEVWTRRLQDDLGD